MNTLCPHRRSSDRGNEGRWTRRDGRSTRESRGGRSGDDAVRETLTRLLPERLHRLQRTTSLPVVFGGAVRNTSAGPRLVIDRLVGTIGQSLHGLTVDPGRGVGGAVLRDAVLVRAEDYAAPKGITHHYDRIVVDEEHLTSVMAVARKSTRLNSSH